MTVGIVGAGGHGHVVASILRAMNVSIGAFFDDSFDPEHPEVICGVPLAGAPGDIGGFRDRVGAIYVAVGDNQRRAAIVAGMRDLGLAMPALIHPAALIEPGVAIGEATVVCMGALVATEVSIGTGCIVNTGCSVDHESRLGDFVHLAPRVVVAGRTTIGNHTFVGIGAAIADRLTIGAGATIGAGSVVLREVAGGSTIVGVHH